MGLGAAIGSMGLAWMIAGAGGAGVGAGAFTSATVALAVFVATFFVATFFVATFLVVAFLATFVAAFFATFVATFLAAFVAGVFFAATFLAALAGFATLLEVEDFDESAVLFLLIRSMFWEKGYGGIFEPREKGEDDRNSQ
jgi:hypothetical protein